MESHNYKNELQDECYLFNLGTPTYITVPSEAVGTPAWIVTVRWGNVANKQQSEYTSPQPIEGNKKDAEQIAAKHALEIIRRPLKPLLSPKKETSPEPVEEETPLKWASDAAQSPAQESLLTLPPGLIAQAVGIANHRLSEQERQIRRGSHTQLGEELKRLERHLPQKTHEEFASELAELAMGILRGLHQEAKSQGINIY